MDLVPFRSLGKACFRDSGRVFLDYRVRGIHDYLRRPVVLLQTEQLAVRIILPEVQDILDSGAAECINRLGIIPDDTDVAMELAQLLQNQILGRIGILVLVHENVVEPGCDVFQRGRIVTEQYVHVQQDIVEIHHAGLLAFRRIEHIDVADFRLLRMGVIDDSLGILFIYFRRDEVVFRHGYAAEHILRLVDLVVKFQFFQARLYGTDGITGIIDCKSGRISEAFCIFSQETDENRVERPHIQTTGLAVPYHCGNSLFHLSSSFLGECQCQNPVRLSTVFQDIGDPARKNPGFSRSRAGNYEYRTLCLAHCSSLLTIKPL